ncbi:hypothetical protein MIMGU_mgv1a022116mg [Erythranthe guttata]|uniref:Uncharacterized protein n=1 Tax=Erythranthe guttata TaxID=4155 RepID=A0A022REM2_ERYGU|nr:hypothetical protein MIMGU_mgv1a022116mg [Erythranthe guttata]
MAIIILERRKRGCSSSSSAASASSRIRNYRLNKRAILVGRTRAGLGGSRSGNPVPVLRTVDASPKCSQPVSARRLAATLWEMNEMIMPSPKMSELNFKNYSQQQQIKDKNGSKMVFKSEKMQSCNWGLHLSDPLHSPAFSEKMDRFGRASRQRTPSISQRHRSTEQNVADFDCISNASFMEIETRSRPQTSSGSVSGNRNRLKDISNSLTTSKELLKIINRMCAHADQPSSTTSVISALHTELERARLQVNHLIQEKQSDKSEIFNLLRHFEEAKKSWKDKENRSVEAAIESVACELEAEKKLRRRLERLNKKLGIEIAEMKSSFTKVVKELENEKRAREKTEEVCDELTSESKEVREGAEKESGVVEFGYRWREERGRTKMSEEKNSAISKMRRQLEIFLGSKRDRDEIKGRNSVSGDGLERERLCHEERQRYKPPVKGGIDQDQVLSSTRLLNSRLSWASRDDCNERKCEVAAAKSRMGDVREGQSTRRSKW